MKPGIFPLRVVITLCGSVFAVAGAWADFELVADFEDLATGPISGQDGWYAASVNSVVTADPANPSNQVLAVTTDSTLVRHALLVPDGEVRMVFLRFRFGGQQSYSFGLSDIVTPTEFGHFEVELSMTNQQTDLRINDDGQYVELLTLAPDTWYKAWILVDNFADHSTIYLSARSFGGASEADLLAVAGQSEFVFRDGSAGNLLNFFIKTGGGSSGNSGPLYVDDIYVENSPAVNLNDPAARVPDCDQNGDVDLADAALLVNCLNGPGNATAPPACLPEDFDCADVDGDHDVDLRDFQALGVMFSTQ